MLFFGCKAILKVLTSCKQKNKKSSNPQVEVSFAAANPVFIVLFKFADFAIAAAFNFAVAPRENLVKISHFSFKLD